MRRQRWALVLASLAVSAAAGAQYPVTGPEFPVNAATTGDQRGPDVARLDGDRMVVVWASGTPSKVTARLFDSKGNPTAGEFVVNNYTGDQYSPHVASDLAGNFVIVWSDQGRNDGSIFFDRRDHDGGTLNIAVPVETYTTGLQQNPAVAMSPAGNFVIVWQSYSGIDPSDSGVFAQRFDASGNKVGGEFQVNQYTTGYQRNPRVAMITSGDFIVTWSSQQDAQSGAVMARRYDSAGNPLGGEFQVNTNELGAQYRPDVALDPAGQAIIVWQSFLQDGDGPGIYGQRLDGSGNKLGPEFNVNTYTTGTQRSPRVAAGPDSDFTVLWESFGNEGDPNSEAIVSQHFEGNGHRDQTETIANVATAGNQQLPSIVCDDRGQFVAVWESGGQDGSGYGIFGREREVPRGAPANVDAHASGGVSNVNGVLESGERVLVETAFRNTTGAPLPLTGTASNFTGPAGDAYLLNDSTADYDTIPIGITTDCAAASGNCYEMTVSGPRLTPHWDATFDETLSDGHSKRWSLHVGGSFADVPQNAFYPFIENLFHNGVTGGCATGYCPASNVTRAQMAVFLLKARWGAAFIPAPATGTAFADVTAGNLFAPWIEELAREGVTGGCGGGNYCPNNAVTRQQMAVFLLKTHYGASYTPPTGVGLFADVTCPSVFCNFIEDLYNQQITGGCQTNPVLLYCPGNSVLRQQMAVFLVKTFSLQLYGN